MGESCKGWHCFYLSLLPWRIDRHNSALNHWSLRAHSFMISKKRGRRCYEILGNLVDDCRCFCVGGRVLIRWSAQLQTPNLFFQSHIMFSNNCLAFVTLLPSWNFWSFVVNLQFYSGDSGGTLAFHKSGLGSVLFVFLSVLLYLWE